jgi:hypothetical protein
MKRSARPRALGERNRAIVFAAVEQNLRAGEIRRGIRLRLAARVDGGDNRRDRAGVRPSLARSRRLVRLQPGVEGSNLGARRGGLDRIGGGAALSGAKRLLRRGARRVGADRGFQLGQRLGADSGFVVPSGKDALLLPALERVDAAERFVGLGGRGRISRGDLQRADGAFRQPLIRRDTTRQLLVCRLCASPLPTATVMATAVPIVNA